MRKRQPARTVWAGWSPEALDEWAMDKQWAESETGFREQRWPMADFEPRERGTMSTTDTRECKQTGCSLPAPRMGRYAGWCQVHRTGAHLPEPVELEPETVPPSERIVVDETTRELLDDLRPSGNVPALVAAAQEVHEASEAFAAAQDELVSRVNRLDDLLDSLRSQLWPERAE